jgi:hypothetical protein
MLAEAALVPSFHTNIVSLDRLMQRNVHWNTERQELRYKSEIFGIVEKQHGQWVLEYSPLQTASFYRPFDTASTRFGSYGRPVAPTT